MKNNFIIKRFRVVKNIFTLFLYCIEMDMMIKFELM